MTIKDYVSKHARRAQTDGLRTAAYGAATEAALKAARPIAQSKATPIWEEDWDICLVLDATRWDLWTQVAGETDWLPRGNPRWSVGSTSPEWLSETFHPRHAPFDDVAYVTANPFSSKQGDEMPVLDEETFPLDHIGFVDEVWRDQWPHSDELPTVGPETLTRRALWAWENQQPDRLVVHYMQPHIPFRSRPEWFNGWELDGFGSGGGRAAKDDWQRVRDGELDPLEFWTAYKDNLRWVLEEVNRWRHLVDADILVTSDHGNAMGEWGQWSHPPRSANPVLRRVPWVCLEAEARNTDFSPMAPPEQTNQSETDVESRLEALGYR